MVCDSLDGHRYIVFLLLGIYIHKQIAEATKTCWSLILLIFGGKFSVAVSEGILLYVLFILFIGKKQTKRVAISFIKMKYSWLFDINIDFVD